MSEQPEPTKVNVAFGGSAAEYRFVSAAEVFRPREMVYLDFWQHGPDSTHGVGIARLVVSAEVAESLAEQLSLLLEGRS